MNTLSTLAAPLIAFGLSFALCGGLVLGQRIGKTKDAPWLTPFIPLGSLPAGALGWILMRDPTTTIQSPDMTDAPTIAVPSLSPWGITDWLLTLIAGVLVVAVVVGWLWKGRGTGPAIAVSTAILGAAVFLISAHGQPPVSAWAVGLTVFTLTAALGVHHTLIPRAGSESTPKSARRSKTGIARSAPPDAPSIPWDRLMAPVLTAAGLAIVYAILDQNLLWTALLLVLVTLAGPGLWALFGRATAYPALTGALAAAISLTALGSALATPNGLPALLCLGLSLLSTGQAARLLPDHPPTSIRSLSLGILLAALPLGPAMALAMIAAGIPGP